MLLISLYYIKLFIIFLISALILILKIFILLSILSLIYYNKSTTQKIILLFFILPTIFLSWSNTILSLLIPSLILFIYFIIHFNAYSKKKRHEAFLVLVIINIQFLADMYSILYIPPQTRTKLSTSFKKILIFVLLLTAIIFFSFNNLVNTFIFLITISLISRAIIILATYSIIFTHTQSPQISWIKFPDSLISRCNQSPIKAVVEEDFFDDLLDIEEPFSAYPIFFKSDFPVFISREEELTTLWYIVRWESTLSKHSGLTTHLWSLATKSPLTSAPNFTFSTHTPLIPILSEDLFLKIKKINLPTIDVALIPPTWDPYIYITNHYNWPKSAVKPERVNEIEEEDWQCSLNRTLSLHLSRRTIPHCLTTRIWW